MSDISFTPVSTTVSLPSVDATVGIPPQSYSIVKPTSDLLSEERPEAQTDTPAVWTLDGTIDDILVDDLLTEARSVLAITDQDDAKLATVTHKLIDKVEELAHKLAQTLESQTELETSLVVTKSNLTLALSNTEMLEEALQRASPGSKTGKAVDLGWRRWSDREGAGLLKRAGLGAAALDGLKEGGDENGNGGVSKKGYHVASSSESDAGSSIAATSPMDSVQPPIRPSTTAPTHSASESRFFKFRFGGGSKSAAPTRPGTPTQQPQPQQHASTSGSVVAPQHLTSASSSSLSLAQEEESAELKRKQRLEELETMLSREKEAREAALAEKVAMEEELEGLSAALFEEANKMVAIERRRCAEVEEELEETRHEREALRGALRIVEGENTSRKQRELEVASSSSSTANPHLGGQSSKVPVKSSPNVSPTRIPTKSGIPTPIASSSSNSTHSKRDRPRLSIDANALSPSSFPLPLSSTSAASSPLSARLNIPTVSPTRSPRAGASRIPTSPRASPSLIPERSPRPSYAESGQLEKRVEGTGAEDGDVSETEV